MKSFLTITLFIFFFAFSVFSQTSESPRLLDEFGDLTSDDLTARLDPFVRSLKDNPNKKGFIVIYRDKDLPFGFPIRFSTKLRSYLSFREIPSSQLEFINGGLLNQTKIQLWLVSADEKLLLDALAEAKFIVRGTTNFDGFSYPTKEDGSTCCIIDSFTEPSKKSSLDKFAEELKKNPDYKGYIIFYGQYCADCGSSARYSKNGKYLGVKPDIYFDSAETIARILSREKSYLVKNHGIKSANIVTINGGYREWQKIELWIVPAGGAIPKPTPEFFPKGSRKSKIK